MRVILALGLLAALAAAQGDRGEEGPGSHTNKLYRFSIRWPAGFVFSRDKQLIGDVMDALEKEDPDSMAKARRANVGYQFFLFPAPGQGVMPHLTLTTSHLDPGPPISSMGFAKLFEQSIRQAGATVCHEPIPVKLDGRDCARIMAIRPDKGGRMLTVQYIYVHLPTRITYLFSIADNLQADLKNIAALEQVLIKGVRFQLPKPKKPKPGDPTGTYDLDEDVYLNSLPAGQRPNKGSISGVMTLSADGKATLTMNFMGQQNIQAGTWKRKDTTIELTARGQTSTGTFKDGVVTFVQDTPVGKLTLRFVRRK